MNGVVIPIEQFWFHRFEIQTKRQDRLSIEKLVPNSPRLSKS